VANNKDPFVGYDADYDRIENKEDGSPIEYWVQELELQIKKSLKTRPAKDGHADDWDSTLSSKHKFRPEAQVDLCVILQNPQHIGLTRHSLRTMINYFDAVEPNLNYKLIVLDVATSLKAELNHDFPIDAFIESGAENTISQETCSADFILNLKEFSFAKWELWDVSITVFRMGIEIMSNDDGVNAIYLTGSSNSIDKWTTLSSKSSNFIARYRINSDLEPSGTVLIRKNIVTDTKYEMCLDTAENCQNNQINGLFENHHQSRLYNYPSY